MKYEELQRAVADFAAQEYAGECVRAKIEFHRYGGGRIEVMDVVIAEFTSDLPVPLSACSPLEAGAS